MEWPSGSPLSPGGSGDSDLEVVGDFSEGLKALGVFKRGSEDYRRLSEGLRSLGVFKRGSEGRRRFSEGLEAFGCFKQGFDGFGEGLSLLSEDLKVSGRCPELAGNSPATAPLAPTEPGHLIS